MTETHAIRVVAFCEGEKWVAQCVEYDIGAQADDLDKAKLLFSIVLEAEIAESVRRFGVPFKGIPSAPAQFEEMWGRRSSTFASATMHSDGVGVELALVA